jgi:outer membrane lipoprotein
MILSTKWFQLVFVFILGGLLGCQAAVSSEIRAQVDETLTFEQVFSNPEQYRGKLILWGGEIIGTRNTQEGAMVEVLERPLGADERPGPGELPRGRFLVAHKGFLDPAVYSRGREITVVGAVIGKRLQTLDETEYTYPVVEDRELVLWGPRRRGPAFHIGIGATIVR